MSFEPTIYTAITYIVDNEQARLIYRKYNVQRFIDSSKYDVDYQYLKKFIKNQIFMKWYPKGEILSFYSPTMVNRSSLDSMINHQGPIEIFVQIISNKS